MTLSAGLAVASRSLGRLMICNPCSSRLHTAGTPVQVFRQLSRAAGKPAELPWIASGMGNGGKGGGRRSIRVASGGSDGAGNAGSGGLWGSYLAALESSPMLTRCITCAVLNGIGDIFCQLFVEGKEFSAKRCATFTLLGLVYVGPILTMWYGALGSMVTAPGTMGVIISLLVDQFLFAPLFIASFMSVMCLIEGDPNKIVPKLRQDLPEALKVNWMLWIPAQFINFQFVPPNLRTLAVNVVALLWNVYMSYQGHKVVAAAPEAVLAAPVLAATKGKGRK